MYTTVRVIKCDLEVNISFLLAEMFAELEHKRIENDSTHDVTNRHNVHMQAFLGPGVMSNASIKQTTQALLQIDSVFISKTMFHNQKLSTHVLYLRS